MHRRFVLAAFALLAFAVPAAAQQPVPDTPEGLVRALIAVHAPFILDVGPGVFDSEAEIRRFFTPELAEALLRSQRLAQESPGEIVEGTLDFDPIAGSNAPEMRDLMIEPGEVEGERSTVAVSFRREIETVVRLRYHLRVRDGRWQIEDISSEGEGSDAWSVRRTLRMPD